MDEVTTSPARKVAPLRWTIRPLAHSPKRAHMPALMTPAALSPPSARPVAVSNWLLGLCGLIFVMVVVGGITRLTESGLSITEWKPITGAIPPLTEGQWLREFELYKRIPEYQQINRGMSLE